MKFKIKEDGKAGKRMEHRKLMFGYYESTCSISEPLKSSQRLLLIQQPHADQPCLPT